MNRTKDSSLTEAAPEQPESSDPDYLAWKKAKVRAALREADEAPTDVVSQDEVWKKLGVDR